MVNRVLKKLGYTDFVNLMADSLGFDVEVLTPSTSFTDDLGVDSLSLINFLIKLERRLGIRIGVKNICDLKDIGHAYDLLVSEQVFSDISSN